MLVISPTGGIMFTTDETVDCTSDSCSRAWEGPCEGELFTRVSRSGLTVSTICELHAGELEASLDAVAERYPEVNHLDGCTCWGCSDGSY
jgi:hypothetical protein